MVQVTMTGPEYAELLEKGRQLEELVSQFKSDRKFSIPEGSVGSYSTGTFSTTFEFPAWVQFILLKDMEEQLLAMSEVEFARLVKSGQSFYSSLEKVFRADMYSDRRGFVNIREFSKKVNNRWEVIKKRLDAGENLEEVQVNE